MAGYSAFQEKFVTSDQKTLEDFIDYGARRLRYSILWSMYENTAYDKVHAWSASLKTEKGLYKYIRNIYNPSYRIGEFWKSKLLGGTLDPAAGDGSETPSCLPILTENADLRPAIGQVWQWSNWQIKKDVFGLWTTVMGDGILKIVDSPKKEKVYIKPVHPSHLRDVTLDEFGNVKGYEIEYDVADPEGQAKTVKFREVVTRVEGETTIYHSTYRNESLYAWEGNPDGQAEWTEDYGFVPMVVLQHNDVGLDFGWSELHPGLSKFREVDDQASKLHDQIRKLVEGAWLLAGVSKPTETKKATGQEPTEEKPQPGRTEQKFLYSTNENAKAHSLVAPIEVEQVTKNIMELVGELERDYPELRVDIANASGDISGRALRYNRAPAVAKVLQRRPNYDNSLVRAQMMAVAIGGMRGYDNFSGFDLDSFDAGDLDHSIGNRPVFDNDPIDDLEEDKLFWENAELAKKAGVPLPVYLKRQGWSEKEIEDVTGSEEYMARQEASRSAMESLRLARSEGSNQKRT
jgi:hypothetical protein